MAMPSPEKPLPTIATATCSVRVSVPVVETAMSPVYTVVSMALPLQTQALPRGRHAAPRDVVREAQRGRMLEAMAAAVAAKGYGHVAVADVIEGAGVSRK